MYQHIYYHNESPSTHVVSTEADPYKAYLMYCIEKKIVPEYIIGTALHTIDGVSKESCIDAFEAINNYSGPKPK